MGDVKEASENFRRDEEEFSLVVEADVLLVPADCLLELLPEKTETSPPAASLTPLDDDAMKKFKLLLDPNGVVGDHGVPSVSC